MKMARIILTMMLLMFGTCAHAALASITAVPTAWRLQNYVGVNISVFFTGVSSCGGQYGGLTLSTTASPDDAMRFWAMMSSAKKSHLKVIVGYDDATCVISNFALAEQ